ncbi:sensor histidine kinase [Alloiococcus sp. CFN-8]|uniref:sensor histidine kinase n=1 Tax=Alloiococcus sp. CFN-8 TaxID=3416081 RepID=UPI003CF2D36C
MLLILIVTIIVQIYSFLWITNYLFDFEERPNNLMTLSAIVVYIVNGVFFAYINFDFNGRYLIIFCPLLINLLIYRKNIYSSVLGFTLAYTFNIFAVSGSLIIVYYLSKLSNQDINIYSSPLSYILIGSIYLIAFIARKRIVSFLSSIKLFSKQLFIPVALGLILGVLAVDTTNWRILPTDDLIIMENFFMELENSSFLKEVHNSFLKEVHNFLYSILIIISIMSFFYLKRLGEKASKMKALNRSLTEKITELQKLKHDYGSEISGLYGLYKLGDYTRLEKMLKDIIKRYALIDVDGQMSLEASAIVKTLFTSVNGKKINIRIRDEGSYSNIVLSEPELYKILSNIIRNAVEALEGVEGAGINYNSYNGYKKLVIDIENIGQGVPIITEEALKNIYSPGYSTKGKDKERGYGLAIVKEFIDSVGGKIIIISKENSTLFRLEIPRME